MSDISKLLEGANAAERFARQNESALEAALASFRSPAIDILSENSATSELFRTIQRQQEDWRRLIEPVEGLGQLGMFTADSPLQQELTRMQESMALFEDRFRLPDVGMMGEILQSLDVGPVGEALARYAAVPSAMQSAMEAMQAPWLDWEDVFGSASRFAAVQGIGSALSSMPSFGDSLTEALRLDLGDWRDPIDSLLPEIADGTGRAEFLAARGYDRELTALPAPAFRESVSLARLDTRPPRPVEMYGDSVPVSGDADDEDGFIRTNDAHGWLFRLETHLRAFIDAQMEAVVGPDWHRPRIPGDVYERLILRKREAELHGAPVRPLLAYADFTDYEKIICRKDNWREVFRHFFVRPESIRESFQRLYPIRLDTMHARPITQDDALLLYVETRRLIRVIVVN